MVGKGYWGEKGQGPEGTGPPGCVWGVPGKFCNSVKSIWRINVGKSMCEVLCWNSKYCQFSKISPYAKFESALVQKSLAAFSDETIECVKCSCPRQQDFSKNNFGPAPPRPATCQDIPLPYGAIMWDDGDCILDDWDTPVALRPGEERQW